MKDEKTVWTVSIVEQFMHMLLWRPGYHVKRPIVTKIEVCAVCHKVLTSHIDLKEVDETKISGS